MCSMIRKTKMSLPTPPVIQPVKTEQLIQSPEHVIPPTVHKLSLLQLSKCTVTQL